MDSDYKILKNEFITGGEMIGMIGMSEIIDKLNMHRKKLINCAFLFYILGVLCVTFIVRETMVLRTPENRGLVLQPFREFEEMMNGTHFF